MSIFLRTLASSVVVLAAAAVSLAQGQPDGYGVRAASGSTFTADITNGDVDDYVFDGFEGQRLDVTLKLTKNSRLDPILEVLRPDGTVIEPEDGLQVRQAKTSVKASFTLDATGVWKVRVRGEATLDGEGRPTGTTAGEYSLSLRYSALRPAKLPQVFTGRSASGLIAPRETDSFDFRGYEGQRLTATVTIPRGGALQPEVRLVNPAGRVVPVAPDDPALQVSRKGSRVTAKYTLNETGAWQFQVFGAEIPNPDPDPNAPPTIRSTGSYAFSLRLTSIRPAPSIEFDDSRQYRFSIPATGGADVSFTLSYRGERPTFGSFVAPGGRDVPDVAPSLRTSTKKTSLTRFRIPEGFPQGVYELTFEAADGLSTNVGFQFAVKLPRGLKPQRVRLDALEPLILQRQDPGEPLRPDVNPPAGGPGTLVVINVANVIDRNNERGAVRVFLDGFEMELPGAPAGTKGAELLNSNRTVRARVPLDIPEGTFDVIVQTATGQVAVAEDAFTRVPPPVLTSIDPTVGSSAGGFDITLEGQGFRAGRMGVLISADTTPSGLDDAAVNILSVSPTALTFRAPARSSGPWYIAVIDKDSQLISNNLRFDYLSTAGISRVTPSLIPVLGGETIFVKGTNFRSTDHVFLETATPGQYQNIRTTLGPTFVNTALHQFTAPARPKGTYRVYVLDVPTGFETPPRTLSYYSFADMTATLGLSTAGGDEYDAWTSFLADFDKDGDEDLFLSRRGSGGVQASSQTRVLRNNGTGGLTDITTGTGGAMPAPTSDDDWRADRIWVTDVTVDGYPDIVIVTNSTTVPAATKSHLRILVNERRAGNLPVTERVFRDRTADLMVGPRYSTALYGSGGGVADDWRGLDMWVGDIDQSGPAQPPEILITHDEMKEELQVSCAPYCASKYSGGYTYSFYWGGSRAFVWDKTARSGLGRYKFEHNFFPRSSGITVAIFNPPPGVVIPVCSGGTCRGKFTPFVGQRLAVGNIDTSDGKPDVAVLSNQDVQKKGANISSLQVGLNRFNTADGASITDVTSKLTDLGVDLKGDALAIGQPGYPDGSTNGVIALSRAAPGAASGSVLKLIRFKPPAIAAEGADFEDITSATVPPPGSSPDKWQASQIRFIDTDSDGDQDLVLLAKAPPGGGLPAFRILRNESVGATGGVFRTTLLGLLNPLVNANEHFEGDTLVIGDLDRNGTLDFVMSRASPNGPGAETRAIKTDK